MPVLTFPDEASLQADIAKGGDGFIIGKKGGYTLTNAIGNPAQQVLDRMSNLSQTEIDAITDFVNSEFAAGNFQLYDEFFCFSLNATDANTGFIAKTGNPVNAPTHSIDGYAFNSTTQYFDSNWNASTDGVNWTQNDAQYQAFIKQVNGTSSMSPLGSSPGDAGRTISGYSASLVNNASTINGVSSTYVHSGQLLNSNELHGMYRANGTQQILTVDGVDITTRSSTSSTPFNGDISIGSRAIADLTNAMNGTISTTLFSGAIGFNQAAHNTNVRQLLTDLGVTLP